MAVHVCMVPPPELALGSGGRAHVPAFTVIAGRTPHLPQVS